jgi:hypothetical protein
VAITSKNWIVHELARYRAEIVSELRQGQARIIDGVHALFNELARVGRSLTLNGRHPGFIPTGHSIIPLTSNSI